MSTPEWAAKQKLGARNGASPLMVNGSNNHSLVLTFREVQVLEWIAAGKRDREIGTILNVSSRTVQKHVQHILDKLDVETRGAAAADWWYHHR
ncbi:MAG: hypothetical protein QOG67_3680 [Verrucomicrobiota bacterium]|jgi:DNA-binding NarL/FixJ family response regulator